MPSVTRLAIAGLAGGLVLNLIDTPWSVAVMVPRLQAFSEAHGLAASPLVGPWFLLAHFALATFIAWVYALSRTHLRPGRRTAALVSLAVLAVNRAFGFANVLMGLMPLGVFLGFSLSFAVGVLAAGIVSARVLDRAGPSRA
jgi:hypothetical protein